VDPHNGRRYAAAIATTLLAGVLLAILVQDRGITATALLDRLRQYGGALFAVSFVSLGLQAWLSALKWQTLSDVSHEMSSHSPRSVYVFYSALAGIFAQVLPAAFAVTAVRSIVAKLHLRGTVGKAAMLAIYDQLFDAFVMFLGAVICVSAFAAGFSPSFSVATFLLALSAAILLARPILKLAKPLHWVARLLPTSSRWRRAAALAHDHGLDGAPIGARLLRLSVVRYFAICARAAAALVFVSDLAAIDTAWGVFVVQGSSLVALTPGNIGVTEWGWTAVESLLNTDPGGIVSAILVLRLVMLPASVAVALLALLVTRIDINRVRDAGT
jgi:hypothetical protein